MPATQCHADALDEWIRRFLEHGKQGLQSKRTLAEDSEVVALPRENEELKSALGEAQLEVRVLRKRKA